MIDHNIIPDLDPIALPAPVWLLKFLLLLTFVLHIIAMNFAVGGGFIAAVSEFIGKKKFSQKHLDLSKSLSKMLPVLTAFTITLGVAPLLFLQVLYGQFFYTSTVLIAWPWLSVIILLMIGYYGYYIYSFSWEKLDGKRPWLVLISTLLFAAIGFIYTNNVILMLTPEKWNAMYFLNPHGTHLNFDDATLIPRYLHFMVSALAVAGLIVLMWGVKKFKTDQDIGRWAIRYGGSWFLIPTFINIAVGAWFLIALPKNLMMTFMGGAQPHATYFIVGLVSTLLSIGFMIIGMLSQKPIAKIMVGKFFLLVTIVSMVMMRHYLRESYLKPYINWGTVKTDPQWTVIIIFSFLFVGGLIAVGWMVKKAFAKRVGKFLF
jgi:hypothetical protein